MNIRNIFCSKTLYFNSRCCYTILYRLQNELKHILIIDMTLEIWERKSPKKSKNIHFTQENFTSSLWYLKLFSTIFINNIRVNEMSPD